VARAHYVLDQSDPASLAQQKESELAENIIVNERAYRTGVILALFGSIFAFILVLVIILQLNADIVRRRTAEEKLIMSEAKYRNLIENSGWSCILPIRTVG
jgi:PAS domain-containing protein